MIIRDEKIDYHTKYTVDKDHPDSEIVKLRNGRSFTLGEVRRFLNTRNETKKGMVLFYDDMFQYTSLGLIDLLFEMHKLDLPIPIEAFFNRRSTSEQFVSRICEAFDISQEEIDYVFKKYYSEILRRSPVSKNAKAFLKMRQILHSQLFVFKYNADGLEEIMRSLRDEYKAIDGDYVALDYDYLNGRTEAEFIKENLKGPRRRWFEMTFIRDAGSFTKIIKETHLDDEFPLDLFTTEWHNGIEDKEMYSILESEKGYGDGNYTVSFIKEGF